MKIQARNAVQFVRQCEALAVLAGIDADTNMFWIGYKLSEKLRRIEARASREYTRYCNEGYSDEERDAFDKKITKAVLKLLPGLPADQFHLNGDPRGYALKTKIGFAQPFGGLHRDIGGYGILAPEF